MKHNSYLFKLGGRGAESRRLALFSYDAGEQGVHVAVELSDGFVVPPLYMSLYGAEVYYSLCIRLHLTRLQLHQQSADIFTFLI